VNPHRIRRLRWSVHAAHADDAFALRHLLRERGDAVQAALARALNGLVPDDEVIHLGRIELRLGAASLDALARDFELGIELAARESVQAALGEAQQRQGRAPARRNAAAARRDSLRHYLARGLHDWTLAGLAPEDAAQALREAAAEAAEEPGGIEAVLAPAATAERLGALLRWLRLLTPARRQAWVARKARHELPAPLLAALCEMPDADLLLQALRLSWPEAADAPARLAWPRELAAWLATLREPLVALTGAAATAPPPIRPTCEPEAADASLLVPLAGLVLLHPYLPQLLGGCGLVEPRAREFPPAALPRACGLLHWLATGQDEAPEFDLPLVKLLLGAAPDWPLHRPPEPPGHTDRDEALALLQAVPRHWRALRGTGADGLRLSFLQRRGLLARAEGGWRLHMQGESYDLLLASLPWALGPIRLPWMARPLHVEWTAP